MRAAFDAFAAAVLYGGLFGLLALALAIFGIGAKSCLEVWRETFRNKGAKAISLLAAVLATMYGGSKVGRITVDDPYIYDTGSFVGTNNFIYVSIAKRYDFVPDDTQIKIWRRLTSKTNATDWLMFSSIYKLSDFPRKMTVAIDPRTHYGSTNYNWLVAANYVQPPVVHTNGVWQIKGFIITDGENPPSPATYAFPNTKTIKKEDE